MIDGNNREIKYMRLSITDMCNFRCEYCMPDDQQKPTHTLSLADIELIATNLNKLGITKVKLTGGEPLVRDDVAEIVNILKTKCNIKEVTLTTNGALLHKYLHKLEKAGLDSITISIDTLKEEHFNDLVKRQMYQTVIQNIKLAANSKINNIKLNVVPIQKYGNQNIIDLCNFANSYQLPIRFIEMMPIGLGRKFPGYDFKSLMTILEEHFGSYQSSPTVHGNGPACYYKFTNLNIDVGIISAVSNKFCDSCNRIRVTSTGHLKQCLHYNYNIDLLETLNRENGLEEIRGFVITKPRQHAFKDMTINKKNLETLKMSEIGG